jgi:uncharacterized RDD family membrane protein YckC
MFYDCLLLLALLFTATFIFILFYGEATATPDRYYLQLYLWCVAGLYFSWIWSHAGRTLGMQAWRIRLMDVAGKPLSFGLAMKRYILASVGLLAGGMGFLWMLADRDRRFLHDRLTGSRLILETT